MNTGIGGGGRSCLLKLNMLVDGLKHLEETHVVHPYLEELDILWDLAEC